MAVDCSNTLAIKEAVCKNATDMKEMITGGVDDTTTNYGAKTVLRMVKDRTEGASPFFGVDYVWIDSSERNSQTGMIDKEFGYQTGSNEVYRYNGSNWILQTTFEIISMDSIEGSIGRINNPLCDIPFNNNLDIKQGSGSVSVERASTDTKVNIYGELENLAIDEASVSDGMTIEESSTNYVLYSDDASLYYVNSCDYIEDYTENNITFGKFVPIDGSGNGQVNGVRPTLTPQSFVIGDKLTQSFFVKADGISSIMLRRASTDTGSSIIAGTIDITTGTVSNYDDYEIFTEEVSSDIYKVSFSYDVVADITSQSNYSYWVQSSELANGVDGFYVGAWQVELLDYASSYIPTTDSAVTRALPYVTLPSKYNLPSPTEGSICFDFKMKSFKNPLNYIFGIYKDPLSNVKLYIGSSGRINFRTYNEDAFTFVGDTILEKDKEYSVRLVWSNSNVKIFLDCILELSISYIGSFYGANLLTEPLRIGGYGTLTTSVGNMEFKNFKTYNFALTPTEIKLLG